MSVLRQKLNPFWPCMLSGRVIFVSLETLMLCWRNGNCTFEGRNKSSTAKTRLYFPRYMCMRVKDEGNALYDQALSTESVGSFSWYTGFIVVRNPKVHDLRFRSSPILVYLFMDNLNQKGKSCGPPSFYLSRMIKKTHSYISAHRPLFEWVIVSEDS